MNKIHLLILFSCAGFFLFSRTISNGDSLKNKFPINDPRNPDCPCHRQQELAEQEYRSRQSENHQESLATLKQSTNKFAIKKLFLHHFMNALKRKYKSTSHRIRNTIKRKRNARRRVDDCFSFLG
jgi:hypothetical protein